jgi:hypothetical protein
MISASIGTGLNAAWEVRINGNLEMSSATSGAADLGANLNGSIKVGNVTADTANDYYDNVAVSAITYANISSRTSTLANYVNFEGGSSDWSPVMSHSGATIDTSPDKVLDPNGGYSLKLQRNNSVANATIGLGGTNAANLITAQYSFLFAYTSNTGEGVIANFQDSSGGYKAGLHLSTTGKLLFYDAAGSLVGTGTTTLNPNQVYSITATVGTGTSGAIWEIGIDGRVEMSGRGNLGMFFNGSINLGGTSACTDTYYYDDIALSWSSLT